MKTPIIVMIVTLGWSAFDIYAQTAGGGPPIPPIISALDINGDNTIDADEIAKAPESLKNLDENGDGKLSADELRPPRPNGVEGPGGPGDRPPAKP